MTPRFSPGTVKAPPRRGPVPRTVLMEREGCLGCIDCVKRRCVYRAHDDRRLDIANWAETTDEECKECLRCIQECRGGVLYRALNPEYARMGGKIWTGGVINAIWRQAETGTIPVSGAGYGGPFSGPGWDSFWTDMSEIVRPTRDGIHGREYISTSVLLGRRPIFLDPADFSLPHPLIEIPLPILFEIDEGIPFSCLGADALRGIHLAAGNLKTALLSGASLTDAHEVSLPVERLAVSSRTGLEVLDVAARGTGPSGAGIIIIEAGRDGYGPDGTHISDAIHAAHSALVEAGSRDEVSLLAKGGIYAAETVAKAVLAGADAVVIDTALVAALGCSLCEEPRPEGCPARLGSAPADWAEARVSNLIASWHGQILEILGAMGLREVRRARGETGRTIRKALLDREMEEYLAAPVIHGKTPREDSSLGISASPPSAGSLSPASEGPSTAPRPGPRPRPSRYRNPILRRIGFGGRPGRREGREARNPVIETLGDMRWTDELIMATWEAASTGRLPGDQGTETGRGRSGGGFDRMRIIHPEPGRRDPVPPERIGMSVSLNRRRDGRRTVETSVPFYGGGMSFGSISRATMEARARAAALWGTLTCTGEGGYPDFLVPYAGNIITQVATGLFGVSEETIMRAPIIEFKYAQGAKPGLGGHLLGDKVTSDVAAIREAVEGSALFSPFPFHSVYSVEDHKKHLDWIFTTNPGALVSVKVSTPADIDMVAVGSYYAGAHIIHLDGSYGGTGAAPDIAKKNIAMPIEYAVPKAHAFLSAEGIRDEIVLAASGGIRTPEDIVKIIALGADIVVIGTAELIALECVRCGNCERGRGCARGIATTDSELADDLDPDWAVDRISNLYHAWDAEIRAILSSLGLSSIRELTGRSDLIALAGADGGRP